MCVYSTVYMHKKGVLCWRITVCSIESVKMWHLSLVYYGEETLIHLQVKAIMRTSCEQSMRLSLRYHMTITSAELRYICRVTFSRQSKCKISNTHWFWVQATLSSHPICTCMYVCTEKSMINDGKQSIRLLSFFLCRPQRLNISIRLSKSILRYDI